MVIPLGLVNAPAFYSCMMENIITEWDTLLFETISTLAINGTKLDRQVFDSKDGSIFLGGIKLHCGTRSIIDDILIWSRNIQAILIYF